MKFIYKGAVSALIIAGLTISGFSAGAYSRALDPDPIISRQQLEAQVILFHGALEHFTAPSPDKAVALWVEGDQTRSGVLKYAVSCETLKQRLLKEWGPPDKTYWIIGGSSPWLSGHKIISKTDLSPTEIRYVVQYEWASSAGPEPPSTEELVLQKTRDGWCVKTYVQSDGYHSM